MEASKVMANGSVKMVGERSEEVAANSVAQSQNTGSRLVAGAQSQWFGKAGITGLPGEDAWRLPFWQGLRPEFPRSADEATLAEALILEANTAAFDYRNKRTAWTLAPSAAVLMARMIISKGGE